MFKTKEHWSLNFSKNSLIGANLSLLSLSSLVERSSKVNNLFKNLNLFLDMVAAKMGWPIASSHKMREVLLHQSPEVVDAYEGLDLSDVCVLHMVLVLGLVWVFKLLRWQAFNQHVHPVISVIDYICKHITSDKLSETETRTLSGWCPWPWLMI